MLLRYSSWVWALRPAWVRVSAGSILFKFASNLIHPTQAEYLIYCTPHSPEHIIHYAVNAANFAKDVIQVDAPQLLGLTPKIDRTYASLGVCKWKR